MNEELRGKQSTWHDINMVAKQFNNRDSKFRGHVSTYVRAVYVFYHKAHVTYSKIKNDTGLTV